MQSLVSSFREAQGEAESAGKAIGTNFTKSVQSGLKQLPSIAQSAVSSLVSVLNSAQSSAYASGAYIGQGLANGMRSALGEVRSAAAQLAAAADEAVRAKARIASPSKVFAKLGWYMGAGAAEGIKSTAGMVAKAAASIVSIPNNVMNPSMGSVRISSASGVLNESFDKDIKLDYRFEIPVILNGKEIARGTAVYTKEELDRMEKLHNRLAGVV